MIASILGLSILCMIAGFVSQVAHFTLFPVILVFPLIGFPFAILLIIVLVIFYAIRRSREARSAE